MTKLRSLFALGAAAAALCLSTTSQAQNEVAVDIHVPWHSKYRVELFRTGDRLPTRTMRNFDIYANRTIIFNDVPAGYYFLRVTQENDPHNYGQAPRDWPVFSWAWWLQLLPDCWVRYHG